MTNILVYEDDALSCIYQPGQREDVIVISFSEMLMRPSPDHKIWAGQPLKNLDIPAIGFVAKSQNWFPQKSVDNAFHLISERLAKYPKRIGYGFSMGGWAILRYAQKFNLDACISFSPQFSINPEEIEDKRFSRHFNSTLNKGMAIADKDGSALNFIVCDPFDRGDWESALKITDTIDAKLIKLSNVGHGSVRCVKGTTVLGTIFSGVLAENINLVENTILHLRKNASDRPFNLAHQIATKRPSVALAIYQKHETHFPVRHRAAFFFKFLKTKYRRYMFRELSKLYSSQKDSHSYLFILAVFLNELGHKPEARSCITRAIELHDSESYRYFAETFQ